MNGHFTEMWRLSEVSRRDGKIYRRLAKPLTVVRISLVPIELPEDILMTVLGEYGTVQEIEDELFSDHIYYNIRTDKK